ncbi:MAG TPA: PEGA domain-containing protein [Vicinamibacterales bacterium]|nr:PEGA domain-containing protein [Vicinamibacterales bacterium]
MNRTVLLIAVACAALVTGAAFFVLVRHQPAANESVVATAPASPEPAPARPSPSPAAPAAPKAEPRPDRRVSAEPEPPAPAEAADPSAGILHIDSDVAGAQVFIDRTFVGRVPLTTSVTPGTHRLNVSAEGLDGVAETIEVTPGPRDITVRLREVRLDASLAVVHKHRLGSCSGQLTGTPQGLRYETSNKEDGFMAGLNDLEKFEVDYLQKTLRVKLRSGKQYDFTDPEGNADRLFVFHRDVDKARQRLGKGDTPASD